MPTHKHISLPLPTQNMHYNSWTSQLSILSTTTKLCPFESPPPCNNRGVFWVDKGNGFLGESQEKVVFISLYVLSVWSQQKQMNTARYCKILQCFYLNKIYNAKGSSDWLQLGVLCHQHVLHSGLTAIQRGVPRYMVTTAQHVLCTQGTHHIIFHSWLAAL